MVEYKLSSVPNQMFNTNINGSNFEFTFRSFRGIVYINVSVDGNLVCSGVRAVPNTNLFPNKVNSAAGGTFQFQCLDDSYPQYDKFDGITCRFIFTPFGE